MSEQHKKNMLEITVDKYTVIQDSQGKLSALRNGLPWRDLVGDNLVLCLAQEVESLREQLAELQAERDKLKNTLAVINTISK